MKLVHVSKRASQLTKKETNRERVKVRGKDRRVAADKTNHKCVQRYCVLGFDFPTSAEEEEIQYSAVVS